MTTENSLPPVAKSFTTFCKKCDADRYHTVLAHTTATSAKVQCEVCKAKSTFKLPKAGAKKDGTAPKRALAGAALKRKEAAASAKKNAHSNEYSALVAAISSDAQKYNMKNKFAVNTKIQHPKFGVGVIRAVQQQKIEVVFEDEVRQLVHNRG